MFQLNFEKEGDTTAIDLKVGVHLANLLDGKWELVCRKPLRTSKQNRMIHALFEDLAVELNGIGIELQFGIFKASFTSETAKEFFKQIYLAGKKTSECETKELGQAIDALIENVNRKGGTLSIRSEFNDEFEKYYNIPVNEE